MPARQYHFSSQNITRDGKHKKAIPNSQWKGPGAYYLRTDAKTNERYWAKRSIAKDANRKQKSNRSTGYKATKQGNIGYGVYSQYHDRGTGKRNAKKVTLTKYPNTNPLKKVSQAKISRATLERTRAEKRRLAKSRRATAKKKATTKPKAVKRKATAKRKPAKRKTVKRSATKRKPAKRKTKRSR